jgi:hypothetical protein
MTQSPPESLGLCIYEIDGEDRIVFCNDEWDVFALANGSGDILFEDVQGNVLWDYVADPSTADLYRRLVADARNGRTVTFSLRCDSPELFRLLEMKITMTDGDRVRFATEVKSVRPRSSENINAAEGTEPLLICSWCSRVNIDNKIWQDVELAVRQMGIFERSHPPAVSHGICPDCYSNITELLQMTD